MRMLLLAKRPFCRARNLSSAMASPQYGQAFSQLSTLQDMQENPGRNAMRRSDVTAGNSISADNIQDRIARQAAVVEVLQRYGYPCEVRAAWKMLKSLLARSGSTSGHRRSGAGLGQGARHCAERSRRSLAQCQSP